jgi:hypothetical protein
MIMAELLMKKIVALLFLLLPMQYPSPALAYSPEEAAVKKWFDAITANDKAAMERIMCRKAREATDLLRLFGTGEFQDLIVSFAKFYDYSRLDFEFLAKTDDGKLAYVKVNGSIGEPKSFLDPRMEYVPFAAVNRRRGASDIAIVVFEDGEWRNCDYLTVKQAQKEFGQN